MAIENECANSQNCKLCDWNKKNIDANRVIIGTIELRFIGIFCDLFEITAGIV